MSVMCCPNDVEFLCPTCHFIREMTQAERDNLKAYYRKRKEMKSSSKDKSSSSSKSYSSTLEG